MFYITTITHPEDGHDIQVVADYEYYPAVPASFDNWTHRVYPPEPAEAFVTSLVDADGKDWYEDVTQFELDQICEAIVYGHSLECCKEHEAKIEMEMRACGLPGC